MEMDGRVSMGGCLRYVVFFFFSSRRRHTRFDCDWSSDVCSSDLLSTLKATELIQDLWPRSVARNRPVAAFHNFTVASTLPVASHFPSGLNATLKIGRASCRERV